MDNEITLNGEVYIKKNTLKPTLFEYCKQNNCWAYFVDLYGNWVRSDTPKDYDSILGKWLDLEGLILNNLVQVPSINVGIPLSECVVTPNGLYLKADPQYNRPNYKEGDPILVWMDSTEYANVRIFKAWTNDPVSRAVTYNGYDPVRAAPFEWAHNHPYSLKLLLTPIKMWPKE